MKPEQSKPTFGSVLPYTYGVPSSVLANATTSEGATPFVSTVFEGGRNAVSCSTVPSARPLSLNGVCAGTSDALSAKAAAESLTIRVSRTRPLSAPPLLQPARVASAAMAERSVTRRCIRGTYQKQNQSAPIGAARIFGPAKKSQPHGLPHRK